MGNKQTRVRRAELKKLNDQTHFTLAEINELFEQFKNISSSIEDDGLIDVDEFRDALGLKDSLMVRRMFKLFDGDNNGTIDFREFIVGLSVFNEKATMEEKLKFSFKIYDFDGDGHISKDELQKMVEASLIEADMNLPEETLKELVNNTFAEADKDGDGQISFEEYRSLVQEHPNMLNNMNIDKHKK
mmetsp:Transcript_10790/g.15802  ORF Transcript_10790/g.15802 Transcript_10790/m.15802 type:complete len:187 (+) Transcript_10790:161-721(+)